MASTAMTRSAGAQNALTTGRLRAWVPWAILGGSIALMIAIVALGSAAADGDFNIALAVFLGVVLYAILIFTVSVLVEGVRQAKDRLVTALVATAFVVALLPLISLTWTVVVNGSQRFDLEFFTWSMRNVTGFGGGAIHAIIGTLEITAIATIISVPIGLMTSIYLVEYGRGPLARAVTFLVDVMTGIPSIVAGLFAYALFSLILGPGTRSGISAAIALSVLMIPVVVRSSEEMLRVVPNELREASYALGVPKWRTIVKVVLPTSIAGITTGVMLSIARVIGETAPLLITAGFTASVNTNPFDERMLSLPVFVYTQYSQQGNPPEAYLDRAWAGALTLILIVMLLNLVARAVARFFAPRTGR